MRPDRLKVDGNVDAERERLRTEVKRAESMLANERFVQKAPAEVVAAEREKLERLPARARRCSGSRASSGDSHWLESLSPWPRDGFGLGRMLTLLSELGDPQLEYPSIHVVGTNGKTTTARATAAMLAREGLLAGCYTSPHVTGWAERIRVGGAGRRRRAGARPCAGRRRSGSRPRSSRCSRRPRSPSSPPPASTPPSSRPASAAVTTPPMCCARRFRCSRTCRSSTRTCSARRARLSPRRSSRSSSPGRRSASARPNGSRAARERGAARVVVEPDGNAARLPRRPPRRFLGRESSRATSRSPGDSSAAARKSGTGPTPRRRCATSRPGCRPWARSSRRSSRDKDVDGMLRAPRRSGGRARRHRVVERAGAVGRRARRAGAALLRARARPSPTRRPRWRERHELGEPVLVTGSLYLLADLEAPPSAEPTYHGRERQEAERLRARHDRCSSRSWRSRSASAISSASSCSEPLQEIDDVP